MAAKGKSVMATKANPGIFDCYANAAPDEPMFVLLARDRHAPALVWLWATLREIDGEKPEVIAEARVCMASMVEWMAAHDRKAVGLGQAAMAAIMELCRAANFGVEHAPASLRTDVEVLRSFLCETVIEKEKT
jgi:hypothetical protein